MSLDREITQAIEESAPTIEKPTCPTKYGWSDKKCEEFASRYVFPEGCLTASTQRAILIRYLNFYSAGEIAAGLTPFDIITAMIGIFPPEECTTAAETLWPRSCYGTKDLICSITPEYTVGEENKQIGPTAAPELSIVEEPGALTKLDTEAGVISELPGTHSSEQVVEKNNPLLYNYTKTISKCFLDTLRKTISSSEATAAQGKGIISIRRVLGYTALTLVRSLVKDPLQMANAFSKAQYRKNLIALLALSEVTYCPPCNKALQSAADAFNKQLSRPIYLFSMIVNRWKELSTSQDKKMAAMLGASCLTHTSYNGMTLIHLLVEVLHHFNIEWSDLCMVCYMDVTKESWRRIAMFMRTFQNKKGPQLTQLWARVIDDGYLKEYSGHDNFALCTIFAASLDDSLDGSGGVWESNWAKTRQAELSDMKKLGYALKNFYSMRLTDVKALTEEAKTLLTYARRADVRHTTVTPAVQAVTLNRSDV